MAAAAGFTPEKLVVGVLVSGPAGEGRIVSALASRWGPPDFVSQLMPFRFTSYYDAEMGTPINRFFVSFARLVDPAELASVKTRTNGIEDGFREDGRRRVNLDPGLLALSRFVLATAKESSHRVALAAGIWAEVTLLFEKGSFRPVEWTYPDYRSAEYIGILNAIRCIFTGSSSSPPKAAGPAGASTGNTRACLLSMDARSPRAAAPALACGLLLCALCSCGLFGAGARVLVQMPEPPPPWSQAFPDLLFIVEYVDARGCTAEVSAGPGKAAWVECAKEQNAPVLAWPCAAELSPDRGDLRPAGGFYPLSLEEDTGAATLRLAWEDGCAALVVKKVRDAGRDTGLFNVARLAAAMREAADPWSWDSDAIAESIAAGSFTAFALDLLPRRDVEVAVGEGTWFLESPFSVPCTPGADGTVGFADVPLGAHTLFSDMGARRSMWVGTAEVLVGPPR